MQSGYTGLQSGQTWVKAGSGMQVRTAGLKANDDTEGRQMQDANRRRFWHSCLLGLMLLALAGNSHSDDSIINRVEALQAGDPAVVLGAHLHSRDALVQLYEDRNYEPAWRSFPAREELLQAIREVSNEGLNPGDYH